MSVDQSSRGNRARATGSIILLNDASDAVAASQSSSLAIALITIYLMMVVLFRSFSTGLLALIPNLLPIVFYFGFLGWSGTALDITTSLVASAVLGLAVDNAVHMIRRYRQSVAERQQVSDPRCSACNVLGDAMRMGYVADELRTGKPMVLANFIADRGVSCFRAILVCAGAIAGILWALVHWGCLAADLILLPVLMKSKLFARAALGDKRSLQRGNHHLTKAV